MKRKIHCTLDAYETELLEQAMPIAFGERYEQVYAYPRQPMIQLALLAFCRAVIETRKENQNASNGRTS